MHYLLIRWRKLLIRWRKYKKHCMYGYLWSAEQNAWQRLVARLELHRRIHNREPV